MFKIKATIRTENGTIKTIKRQCEEAELDETILNIKKEGSIINIVTKMENTKITTFNEPVTIDGDFTI